MRDIPLLARMNSLLRRYREFKDNPFDVFHVPSNVRMETLCFLGVPMDTDKTVIAYGAGFDQGLLHWMKHHDLAPTNTLPEDQ